MFGLYATRKTKVMNLSSYIPNENEKLVLENGLRFAIPFKQHHKKKRLFRV